jgi:hypothetical protein
MSKFCVAFAILSTCVGAAIPQAAAGERVQVVQLNCDAVSRLYTQAHVAACLHEFDQAIAVLERLRASAPGPCRMETDEQLDAYETNLRTLLGNAQTGGAPQRCVPIRTGPTSYSCAGGAPTQLTEIEKDRCRSLFGN